MKEIDKMHRNELYSFADEEIQKRQLDCLRRTEIFNQTPPYKESEHRQALEVLIPGIPASSNIMPPFHCDHGDMITIGENTFINYGATMLDCGGITIGSRCKIGPNCQLYTPNHPIDYIERRKPIETGKHITIGNDCWLGGGVIVCPGVTIGDCCIIAAGSVVTRDIPPHSLAAGNPAVVKREI